MFVDIDFKSNKYQANRSPLIIREKQKFYFINIPF